MRAFLVLFLLLTCSFPAWAEDIAVAQPTTEPANYVEVINKVVDLFAFRYSDNKGVTNYAEVFNALGSLAGFACQMSIREGYIKPGLMESDRTFIIQQTKDGSKYFFSDFLNDQLVGNKKIKTSVWSLVAGAAQQAGAKELPDVQDIADYNFKTLGTADFGVPRVPKKYQAKDLPIDIIKRNWTPMFQILTDNQVDPKFWGWVFALAARDLILKEKIFLIPKWRPES